MNSLHSISDKSLIFASVMYGLMLTVSLVAGVLGIPLIIITILGLGRYCYALLRWVAQGKRRILPAGMDYINPLGDHGMALHLVFFLGLFVFFMTAGRLFGDGQDVTTLRWAGALVVITTFPASAALMALSGNIASSLSPANVVSVIGTFGARYLLLLLGCAALVLLSQLVQQALSSYGGIFLLLLATFVAIWTALAIFVVIGSMIREQREDFDIPGEMISELERQQLENEHGWRQILDRAYASFRSGLVAEGYHTIRQLVEEQHNSIEIYQWVFGVMLTWEDNSHALQIARRFIDELIEQGHVHGALELFEQCRAQAADFSVATASAATLANYARSIGRHGISDELSSGL